MLRAESTADVRGRPFYPRVVQWDPWNIAILDLLIPQLESSQICPKRRFAPNVHGARNALV